MSIIWTFFANLFRFGAGAAMGSNGLLIAGLIALVVVGFIWERNAALSNAREAGREKGRVEVTNEIQEKNDEAVKSVRRVRKRAATPSRVWNSGGRKLDPNTVDH